MTVRHGVQLFADVSVTLHVALESWNPPTLVPTKPGWYSASATEAFAANSEDVSVTGWNITSANRESWSQQ